MHSEKKRWGLAFVSALGLALSLMPGGSGCGELVTEDPALVPIEGFAPEGEYIENQYIFFFGDDTSEEARTKTRNQFTSLGGTIIREHPRFGAFAGEITPSGLETMRRNPMLAAVQVNNIIRANGVQTCPPWGLDAIDQDASTTPNHYYAYPSDGTGVHVYVLDSGIQRRILDAQGAYVDNQFHSEFNMESLQPQIGAGLCTATDCCATPPNCNNEIANQLQKQAAEAHLWDDIHGHGTHLAGIIGGKTHGVAKGVTLHAIRVLHKVNDCDPPEGTTDTFLAGMDAVAQLHALQPNQNGNPPKAVILLAFNAKVGTWTNLFNKLKTFNTPVGAVPGVIIASAGNQGDDACLYYPGGDNGQGPTSRAVITVGSFNESGEMWAKSNRGPCVDLLAPGVGIFGPMSDDCPLGTNGSTSRVHKMDGTSQAAAHVAGVAALLLGNGVPPNEVRQTLLDLANQEILASVPTDTANLALRAPRLPADEVISPPMISQDAACIDIPIDGRLACKMSGACGVCGAQETPCCPGASPCSSGLACDALGTCKEPTATCGISSKPCCANNSCSSGLQCVNGFCQQQSSCGAYEQACCAGDSCDAGLRCNLGQCKPCGGHGKPCCPFPQKSCEGDMACDYNPDGTGGTCTATCRVRCGNGVFGYPSGYEFITEFDCMQWALIMCNEQGWLSRVFFNEKPIPGLNNCGDTNEACCLELYECGDPGAACVQDMTFQAKEVKVGNTTIGNLTARQYCKM